MLINLTEFFNNDGLAKTFYVPYGKEYCYRDGIECPIESNSDAEVTVEGVEKSKARIKVKFSFSLKAQCDRCLEPVTVEQSLDFDREVFEPDSEFEYDEDEQLYLKGFDLDTDELIDDELIMGLPMKVLCKDDCKGLCPKCGSNRNKGECGCDTFVPDPRMAAIQDIFNANN